MTKRKRMTLKDRFPNGIQQGDPGVSKTTGKKVTPEDVDAAAKALAEGSFRVEVLDETDTVSIEEVLSKTFKKLKGNDPVEGQKTDPFTGKLYTPSKDEVETDTYWDDQLARAEKISPQMYAAVSKLSQGLRLTTDDFLNLPAPLKVEWWQDQSRVVREEVQKRFFPTMEAVNNPFACAFFMMKQDYEREVEHHGIASNTAASWESTYNKASDRANKAELSVSALKGTVSRLTGEKDHEIAQLETALEDRIRECNDLKDLIVKMAKNLMTQEGM